MSYSVCLTVKGPDDTSVIRKSFDKKPTGVDMLNVLNGAFRKFGGVAPNVKMRKVTKKVK